MNKLSIAGAILVIIAAAFMTIWGIILLAAGGTLSIIPGVGTLFVVLAIFMLGFGIANLVLSSLILAGRKNLRILAGVFALVGIFFGWIAYIFPTILFLIGAILLFCGKQKEENLEEEMVSNKVSEELITNLES